MEPQRFAENKYTCSVFGKAAILSNDAFALTLRLVHIIPVGTGEGVRTAKAPGFGCNAASRKVWALYFCHCHTLKNYCIQELRGGGLTCRLFHARQLMMVWATPCLYIQGGRRVYSFKLEIFKI